MAGLQARRAGLLLRGKGRQLVVAAHATVQPQAPVRQDAAFEEGVEPVFSEPRKLTSGAGLGVRDDDDCVLLHEAVQHGLLGSVAFVVEPGAIGRPLNLPNNGLHSGLPRW